MAEGLAVKTCKIHGRDQDRRGSISARLISGQWGRNHPQRRRLKQVELIVFVSAEAVFFVQNELSVAVTPSLDPFVGLRPVTAGFDMN